MDENENNSNDENYKVISDAQGMPIQDGAIPQDAESIASGKADAIKLQAVDLEFEQGNYSIFASLVDIVQSKVDLITKTFIPLIEVALIELTGSSSQYKRTKAQINPSFNGSGQLEISLSIVYTVPGYIGVDFEYEDLQSDSRYVYNRITPAGVNITKCEIDTSSGEVTIEGNA